MATTPRRQLIPNVGTTGLYQLIAPFSALLRPNIAYTCVAVRRMQEILAAGDSPIQIAYQPAGLVQGEGNAITSQEYQADLAENAVIVTLQAQENLWVYVPSTYIAAMPDQNGVPYTVMGLTISLAAIPDYLNLDALKADISDLVKDHIGVQSDVTEWALSTTKNLSEVDHAALESARADIMASDRTSVRTQLRQLQIAYDAQTQQLEALEDYIRSLNP